jgi:hypothetical protein
MFILDILMQQIAIILIQSQTKISRSSQVDLILMFKFSNLIFWSWSQKIKDKRDEKDDLRMHIWLILSGQEGPNGLE